MKIVAISDTHGEHSDVELPDGDVLVHTGDFTHFGNGQNDFLNWFTQQPFKYRVLILGNHEKMGRPQWKIDDLKTNLNQNEKLTYVGESAVEIDGVTFGPVGSNINVDVVLSHKPPASILDAGKGVRKIHEAVALQSPKVHIFGHVHQAYGREELNYTTCINAALAGRDYTIRHSPQIVTVNND